MTAYYNYEFIVQFIAQKDNNYLADSLVMHYTINYTVYLFLAACRNLHPSRNDTVTMKLVAAYMYILGLTKVE